MRHQYALAQMSTDTPPQWRTRAACRDHDPELFFPVSEQQRGVTTAVVQQINQAKAVCARCPVRDECLVESWRLEATAGIWAGLTTRERWALAPAQLRPGRNLLPPAADPVSVDRWTPDEVAILRRMVAQGATDKQTAQAVGRSIRAVRAKRQQLRLTWARQVHDCQMCGRPLPDDSRPDRRYCNNACRIRAKRKREAAR